MRQLTYPVEGRDRLGEHCPGFLCRVGSKATLIIGAVVCYLKTDVQVTVSLLDVSLASGSCVEIALTNSAKMQYKPGH